MSQVIYVSEYAGYDPMRSDGKSIVKINGKTGFNYYPVFDLNKGVVNKGVLVLDSEENAETIKELEAFPDFGKGFVKVDKLPLRSNEDGNIITGIVTGHKEKQAPIDKAFTLETKFKRYLELKKKLFNPMNNALRKNMSGSEELTEFENLERELKLKEN